MGHKFYIPELGLKDKEFADFWSPLEPDHNSVRTSHRVEFLRAIERIPEARKALTDLRDEVLPHYDSTWNREKTLDALRELDSLALAEQCRSTLSP